MDREPLSEPPGSGITLAVYRVGPDGVEILVPPARHKRFSRDPWMAPDPPCECSPDCPMNARPRNH